MDLDTGIRNRIPSTSSATPPTPSDPTSPLTPSTASSSEWQEQLASIRKAMSDREKQLAPSEDEWEELSDIDSPERDGKKSKKDRRGTNDDSEGEAAFVRELLRPSTRSPSLASVPTTTTNPTVHENKDDDDTPLVDLERHQRAPGFFPTEPTTDEAEVPRAVPVPPTMEHDAICRICFDGEDPELGRLFSPCLCRGTSRWVHVECLTRWRKASAGSNSFYKCDQCKYEYKLNRAKIAGLASNKYALASMTVFVFGILIFLCGFVATGIIEAVEMRSGGSIFDDYWISDYTMVGESLREAVGFFDQGVERSGWGAILDAASSSSRVDNSYEENKSFWNIGKGVKGSQKKSTLLRRTVQHFIKGFSLVGIASFFQTILASSVLGGFGLRGTLYRAVRPTRRNGDNQVSLSQLVIVMFVVVGTWKTVERLYKLVHWGTQKVLKRVESLVMDVGNA